MSAAVGADARMIRALLDRYATALDSKDWELLRTCFSPDAIAVYSDDIVHRGFDAIREKCSTSLARFVETKHELGDPIIAVEGDRGIGTCPIRATHHHADSAREPYLVVGEYHDVYERGADGAWSIEERLLVLHERSGDTGLSMS